MTLLNIPVGELFGVAVAFTDKGEKMSNKWLFKIELKDKTIFKKYERDYNIIFPSELEAFVLNNNASSPEQNAVDFNGVERIYDETLSFNLCDEEASTFNSAMKAVNCEDCLPFAKDPFGDYFCYNLENETVSFYNHEEDRIEKSDIGFHQFIEMLH